MILFILFLVVLLASFMTLVMNTEKILKKHCPYVNSPTIWNGALFFVGAVVFCSVFFEILPEQLCVIAPAAALIAAVVILFVYSGIKNRCAIAFSVVILLSCRIFLDWDYSVWLLVIGSVGLACCSIVRTCGR